MPSTESKESPATLSSSIMRTPLLLLATGLAMYGLVRWVAPSDNPADFMNVIGAGAVFGAALIEFGLRRWQKKGEKNGG
ncbi:hypothetical protein EGT07_03535 [Herbaspirillum sp. HC18]|nr:hypothetical protein EGT07_03535 [Herbaspirillum sp. HC18]